jgi:hypothetical protein
MQNIFFHQALEKKFDHEELLNRSLPKETFLNTLDRKRVTKVIKNSMALTNRETDPATYMQEDSLKLFILQYHQEQKLQLSLAENHFVQVKYIHV